MTPPPPPPSRIETALEISPLTVLTRGVLEWACPHSFFEELFEPRVPAQASGTAS